MRFDDIIIGAGHNGLTTAAYLARAGRRVLVLERSDHVGGAAVSAMPFPGMPARLSRYSYLVSLLPREIITDLDLDIRLIRRRYSSYTPVPGDPTTGILVDNGDPHATEASFRRVTGDDSAFTAWRSFYDRMGTIAARVFPTMTEPLRSAADLHDLVSGGDSTEAELWEILTSKPLGELLDHYFDDDLVRGIVATDALIGTFADIGEASLRANICFLYHLIGGGTGDWDVPVGGMGSVSGALYASAMSAGAHICTGIDIVGIDPADGTVEYTDPDSTTTTVHAEMLYAACAPTVVDRYLTEPIATETDPRGAQLKINLLLDRLPRLPGESIPPEAAFAGTFHINESASQLHTAWQQARRGQVPDLPPCEVYCHTLSDRSILGPELDGHHSLTLFGLHMPPEVFDAPGAVDHAVGATLASVSSVLAEPIQSLISHDAAGNPCIEVKTPQDLDDQIGLPGGNIFHRSLQWPWAETESDVGAWGVETSHPRLLICGAGARRGGGVSGIPGRNAAAKVLAG
ncbi:NAD(P)/FAD-dependent oxidoreductase [Gordonia sp. ABSL1-1]|uniref:phytoene desaturase family protein n=1 Tax=Gordonia sp. ABSL1-1 TaxID=3053923 RepID=UPI00257430F5|nr:NAD(P)/FAD-dependent oxidoreductase [Gordonia sp. ABSL1-1]MDL9937664.1 NAD(P)/FAD-dependent oxidoreductase [Gordonia sp. ABSL1-1]